MLIIFCLIGLISIFCLGLHAISRPGKILDFADEWASKKLPSWLYKPLIGCVVCTSSIWGVIIFMGMHAVMGWEFSTNSVVLLPILCISAAFVNWFAYSIFELVLEASRYIKVRRKIFVQNYKATVDFRDILED